MKKIIQICCSGVDNVSSTQCSFIVVALCDDGSVWQLDNNTSTPEWIELPKIKEKNNDN